MLLYGKRLYYEIGCQAVASMLNRTDFEIFLAVDHNNIQRLNLKPSFRIHIEPIFYRKPVSHRSIPFLLKFRALQACLNHSKAEQIVLMDADTVVVTDIGGKDIHDALNGYDFGMVEQRTIKGSSMTRREFLDHYQRHTLAWFDPSAHPPALDDFRFYNSGIVLGKHSAFEALVNWAITTMNCKADHHQVGHHMIADQDYFQYWTNTLHPGCCQTLPWKWNHCQHWDHGFPDPGSVVLHFSNFCKGPDRLHLLRMNFHICLLSLKRLIDRH